MDISEPEYVTHWVRVVPVVALGLFLGTIDQSAVGVANVAVADEFGLSNVDVQAVGNVYRVGLGAALPAAIWLCARYGLRRIFLVSMLLYAVTSALCGMAGDLNVLLIFRTMQAVPAAFTAIACIAILQKVLPPARMGPAMLLMVMLVLCAPALAPVLGGYLVTENHWRWVFFIVVPFALLGFLGGAALLPPLRPTGWDPFDWPGFLCLTGGLLCLTVVVTKGTYWGWSSYPILILLVVGVDALVLFVIVERQATYPLIDQRVFRSQPFVLALVGIEVFTTCLASVSAYLPPYLQQVQGMTALGSGLLLVPQAIAFVLSVPVAGVLMMKLGIRWTVVIGATILGTGTIAVSYLLVVTVSWTVLATVLTLRALGLGLVMLPLFGGSTGGLPAELINAGTMVRTLMQRIGSGLTLSVASAYVTIGKDSIGANNSQLLDPIQAPQQHAQQMMSPTSQLGLWQQSQKYASAQVYSDVFFVIGWATLVGVVAVALLARWGAPPRLEDADRLAVQNGA